MQSWLPWPSTPDLIQQQFALAQQATHLYLSHAHDDHAHPETLRRIGQKPLIMGNFAHEGLKRLARDISSHVTLLEDGEPYLLGDLTIRLHLERPDYRTNSILVAETADGRVVNANDCGLDPDLLKRIRELGHTNLFLSTLNFVANGYPFPYLSGQEPDFHERVRQVRQQVVDGFARGIDTLSPDLSIAFAGPVLFSDPLNRHLNELEEARDWTVMVNELHTERHPVVSAKPCMTLKIDHEGVHIIEPGLTLTSCAPAPARPHETTPWNEDDDRDLEAFAAQLTNIARELHATVRTRLLLFICDTLEAVGAQEERHRRTISLTPEAPVCRPSLAHDSDEPHLTIYVTAAHWRAFQRGEIDYDTLLLSYLIRCSRHPDTFDATLHALLRFGPDAGTRAALISASTSPPLPATERLHITHEGRLYDVPARCPHEGALFDPRLVVQINGEACLRCPLHQWAFRLRDGACVKGDPSKRLQIVSTE